MFWRKEDVRMSEMDNLEFWKSAQGRQQLRIKIGAKLDSATKSESPTCYNRSVSSRKYVSVARGLNHLSHLIKIWRTNLKNSIWDRKSEFSEISWHRWGFGHCHSFVELLSPRPAPWCCVWAGAADCVDIDHLPAVKDIFYFFFRIFGILAPGLVP